MKKKNFLYVYEFAQTDTPLWQPALNRLVNKLDGKLSILNASGLFKIYKSGGFKLNRLINFAYMHLVSIFKILFSRADYIFVRTSPPMIQISYIILGNIFKAKTYVWLMDYHPVLEDRVFNAKYLLKLMISILDKLDRYALKKVDCVVCLDPAMAELIKQRCPTAKTVVFPTFPLVCPEFLNLAKDRNADDTFKFIYSGHLGQSHNISDLQEFLSILSSKAKVEFTYSGKSTNALKRFPKMCEELNIKFSRLPFVENYLDLGKAYEKYGFDYGIVILDEQLKGIVSPSKFSGYTSFGLPIIYIGPKDTNAELVCSKFDAGISMQNNSDFNSAIERILLPNTQKDLAKNTENTLEYFSAKSSEMLGDFFVDIISKDI